MRGLATFVMIVLSAMANAQSWQPAPRCPIQPGNMLLMRNGCVLAQEGNTSNVAILCPDAMGSYANGTWTMAPPLPNGYGPWAYSSAVLPDGRVILEGGEYNFGNQVWTSLGAIYDPAANAWTPVQPPAGWKYIGDGASVLLANGIYYQSNSNTNQTAFLNPQDLTWTEGPTTLTQNNNETGWTLLPNGKVLEVASEVVCGTDKGSQIYNPATNQWECGPELPVRLYNDPNNDQYDHELGTTVLTYKGEVLQVSGGLVYATAILDLSSNTWSAGPTPPSTFNQDDAPSAMEPNGKVLVLMGNKDMQFTCQFFEFSPYTNSLDYAPNPPECPSSGDGVPSRLMLLPSGQILFSNWAHQLELYNPVPGAVIGAAPTLYSSQLVLYSGTKNNVLLGKQLNGLSQANFYGDDYQGATNYPLVQLTDLTGHVWFAPTHSDSYNGIAPGTISTTQFDIPAIPPGPYLLSVISNGLRSNSQQVRVIQR